MMFVCADVFVSVSTRAASKSRSKPRPKATRSQQLVESVQSTPLSQGTSSQFDPKAERARSKQDALLRVDLQHMQVISYRRALEIIFNKPTGWLDSQLEIYREITADATFSNLLSEYCRLVVKEQERYHPFSQLANHTIQLLWNNLQEAIPFVVCRNDNVTIQGSAATRIPDCVVVSNSAMKKRGTVDDLAASGPQDLPFFWHEVQTFFEFKMNQDVLTSLMDIPQYPISGNATVNSQSALY